MFRLMSEAHISCLLTRDKVSKLKRRAPRKHVLSKVVLRKRRNEVPGKSQTFFDSQRFKGFPAPPLRSDFNYGH